MKADTTLRERVRMCMASAFAMNPKDLPQLATVETVIAWDSLGHMVLYEAIDKEFPGRIPHATFHKILSEEELLQALREH